MKIEKNRLALIILAVGLFITVWPHQTRAESGVEAGVLTCDVEGGWGYILASSRNLDCVFAAKSGGKFHYHGQITKYGIDIGYVGGGQFIWGVVAPTSTIGPEALVSDYTGVTGGATVGVGGDANILIGGSGHTISLQPISVEGDYGLNVAAGIESISLDD